MPKRPISRRNRNFETCPELLYNLLGRMAESYTTIFLLICTWFLKNRVWKIKLDKLEFLSISNLISTVWVVVWVASKIQVQNRQKIKFIQLDFSNLNFQKSSADQYLGGMAKTELLYPKNIVLNFLLAQNQLCHALLETPPCGTSI